MSATAIQDAELHCTPGQRRICGGEQRQGPEIKPVKDSHTRAKPGPWTSVTVIRVGPPGYFVHISITTPVVSALKLENHYTY
jgi:hypothetical protein